MSDAHAHPHPHPPPHPPPLFTLEAFHAALPTVRRLVSPTACHAWPLLAQAVGAEVWVKHENHAPTGAFKVRGGIVYVSTLLAQARSAGRAPPAGLVTATRGNHGQSLALACRMLGLGCTIVVPQGNSAEKNAAMRAFGAELVVAGEDFDAARGHATTLSATRGWPMVPSFHPALVMGVASAAYELFSDHPDLAAVYVPIGLGSGATALITMRDLLGLRTQIIGVVAAAAPAYALSLAAGRVVATASARSFADGLAVREPDPLALSVMQHGLARIVTVTEDEIADAIRLLWRATHNAAEGAGAASLAALIQECRHGPAPGPKVAVMLCGGNIDGARLAQVLQGHTPSP